MTRFSTETQERIVSDQIRGICRLEFRFTICRVINYVPLSIHVKIPIDLLHRKIVHNNQYLIVMRFSYQQYMNLWKRIHQKFDFNANVRHLSLYMEAQYACKHIEGLS